MQQESCHGYYRHNHNGGDALKQSTKQAKKRRKDSIDGSMSDHQNTHIPPNATHQPCASSARNRLPHQAWIASVRLSPFPSGDPKSQTLVCARGCGALIDDYYVIIIISSIAAAGSLLSSLDCIHVSIRCRLLPATLLHSDMSWIAVIMHHTSGTAPLPLSLSVYLCLPVARTAAMAQPRRES